MIKVLTKHHHSQIKNIRELRSMPLIPDSCYPPTGTVYEAPNGDVVAFGYIYKTNSSIAWLEWVTTNPTYSSQSRHEALESLIPALLTQAKNEGASIVFTSVVEENLINRYKKFDARVGDEGATNLVWRVG